MRSNTCTSGATGLLPKTPRETIQSPGLRAVRVSSVTRRLPSISWDRRTIWPTATSLTAFSIGPWMVGPLNSCTVTWFSLVAVTMPCIEADSSLSGRAAHTWSLASKSSVILRPSSVLSNEGAAFSETANSVASTLTFSGKRKDGVASSYRPVMRLLDTRAVWLDGRSVTTSYFWISPSWMVAPLRSMR